MPQQITLGFRALVDAAEREVETLSVEEARAKAGGSARVSLIAVGVCAVRSLRVLGPSDAGSANKASVIGTST